MLGTKKAKTEAERMENEIIYSRAIKAGKRIYYLDVKKSRNDDLFVAITESKKRVSGTADNPQVSFEKHKIFLYKEDFDKFLEGIEDVISYVKKEQQVQNSTDSALDADAFMQENETKTAEETPKKGFFSKFKL